VASGKSLLSASEREVRFTFDVNALSHYWTAKEFVPAMVKANHGMIVTIASLAAWVTAPDMVEYAASKAAAYAFHEGLTAELKTRYDAPKVRTVVVNPGYTKTPLFTGYKGSNPFLLPDLEPEAVARGVVRQVLSGKSGQVIMPLVGNVFPALAAMPHWYQVGLRARCGTTMTNFRGRRVVKDLDEYYREKEKQKAADPDQSTVLVSEAE
jgi:short-subunit dehydrogenase